MHFLEFDTSLIPEERAEVLVVGSGIGGLVCALTLLELGLRPIIITRGIGNTFYSQGGIACAVSPQDSPSLHFLDTQRAGRGLCNPRSLWVMVEEGPQRIIDLQRWGVVFDEDKALEGGHSIPRVLKVKDHTGKAIYTALWERIKEKGIKVIEGELQEILGEESLEGAIVLEGGKLKFFRTNFLVLATGGASSMFLHSSGHVKGDGIGIALRKGVPIKNPEFVQFHPTVLENSSFLISEAVRGEGAILIDSKGNRFVDELLPRDQVARAIYSKLKEGSKVFLDFRPIVQRRIDIKERFPTIYSKLVESGYDPYKQPIPVVPAAHYYIGGLEVSTYGQTGVFGLYAVGECSCTGVHGANRLASNSLLEGLVFGYRTAYRIYHDRKYARLSNAQFKHSASGHKNPKYSFEDLKLLMWNHCGIEREEGSIMEGIRKLLSWLKDWKSWEKTPDNRKLFDVSLVALSTLIGALQRKESRGCHYRKDFPYQRDEFERDTLINFFGLNLLE
ncbi:L-aspartate oxidase [Thermocrinis sp.]